MSKLTRRQLLVFFGASAGSAVLAPVLGTKLFDSTVQAAEKLKFTPVRLPHPLPIYQEQNSYYATGIEAGNVLKAATDTRLTRYTIGEVVPFAYGPPRCEMTGPTFVSDTLIIAIQHPGEDCPFSPQVALNRDIEMLNLDGTLFTQNRTVPRASNWPSNIKGNALGAPRPSVIAIRRKRSRSRNFV